MAHEASAIARIGSPTRDNMVDAVRHHRNEGVIHPKGWDGCDRPVQPTGASIFSKTRGRRVAPTGYHWNEGHVLRFEPRAGLRRIEGP